MKNFTKILYFFPDLVYNFIREMNNIYCRYYSTWSHKDQTRVDAERRKKPFKRMAFYILLFLNCLIIPKISFTLKKYFSAFVKVIL